MTNRRIRLERFAPKPRHSVVALLIATLVLSCSSAKPAGSRLAQLRERLTTEWSNPTLHFYIGLEEAREGNLDSALASLERVLTTGDGFRPNVAADAPALLADPRTADLLRRFDVAAARTPDAPVHFSLKDQTLIPEGIAVDTTTGTLFVGSMAQRLVLRALPSGRMDTLSRASDSLGVVLGMTVDATTRRLYAVTGPYQPDAKMGRVVAWDLTSSRKVGEWRTSGDAQLNDITVAAPGILYASDTQGGTIWRFSTTTGSVERTLPLGALRGVNGLAWAPDRQSLYAAHAWGVSRVNLDSGTVIPVRPPARQSLAGIDGLYFRKGWLIGVQNVISTGRVVAARLAAGRDAVDTVVTVQSHHHPAIELPTTAAIWGNAVYVLARTNVLSWSPTSPPGDLEKLAPALVLKIQLPMR